MVFRTDFDPLAGLFALIPPCNGKQVFGDTLDIAGSGAVPEKSAVPAYNPKYVYMPICLV